MTRSEIIKEMMKKAIAITGENSKSWTRDAENEIWGMASDWNSTHEESEEIFMCEHENEETGFVNGFYIEYDYFVVED